MLLTEDANNSHLLSHKNLVFKGPSHREHMGKPLTKYKGKRILNLIYHNSLVDSTSSIFHTIQYSTQS